MLIKRVDTSITSINEKVGGIKSEKARKMLKNLYIFYAIKTSSHPGASVIVTL